MSGVQSLLSSLDEPWGICQAEIVVSAEIECLAAVLKDYFRRLGGSEVPFVLVETGFLDGSEFCFQMILEFTVHIGYC